jgi:hypothetical protein
MEGLGVALREPTDREVPMYKPALEDLHSSRGAARESEFEQALLISAGVRTRRRRAREGARRVGCLFGIGVFQPRHRGLYRTTTKEAIQWIGLTAWLPS